jgi:hypothetical protein
MATKPKPVTDEDADVAAEVLEKDASFWFLRRLASIIHIKETDEHFVNVKFRFGDHEEDDFHGPFSSHAAAELFSLKNVSEADDDQWEWLLQDAGSGRVKELLAEIREPSLR